MADPFAHFASTHQKDLRRIARHTRGELQLDDVVSEAWLMSTTLSASDGAPLNLSLAADRQRLLSHLYQHLIRYTDTTVRHAVRLDHAPGGGEDPDAAHPLAHLLVAGDGRDALAELMARESRLDEEAELAGHGSLAACYVELLRRFDNRMAAVAEHLLISTSYAYRRCAQAREWTVRMWHIPVPQSDQQLPGPWRRFRLQRHAVQLAFDFDEAPPLAPQPVASNASL